MGGINIILDSSLCGCCSLRQGACGCVVYTAQLVFVVSLVAGRNYLFAARVTFPNKLKHYDVRKQRQGSVQYHTEDNDEVNAKDAAYWCEVICASYFIMSALTFFALLGVLIDGESNCLRCSTVDGFIYAVNSRQTMVQQGARRRVPNRLGSKLTRNSVSRRKVTLATKKAPRNKKIKVKFNMEKIKRILSGTLKPRNLKKMTMNTSSKTITVKKINRVGKPKTAPADHDDAAAGPSTRPDNTDKKPESQSDDSSNGDSQND
uniref:Uncharacterized protein n=1 Tax=Strigamia maritima TaxID=126957 RepID=T1IPC5_STRMM